jgi:hypothetical protein
MCNPLNCVDSRQRERITTNETEDFITGEV